MDAHQPIAERPQGVTGEREFFFHPELREIARTYGEVDVPRVADDELELVEGIVVVAPAAFPQLDRGEGAQGSQLAQRSLAPARELHVRVGEMQDADQAFSATASRPSPPSDSSIFLTLSPAPSRAAQSASALKRPYAPLIVRQRRPVNAQRGVASARAMPSNVARSPSCGSCRTMHPP